MAEIEIRSSNLGDLAVGELGAKWNARGDRILRYYIDIRHMKLNIHKEISATEIFILQSKVNTLIAAWDERSRFLEARNSIISNQQTADQITARALRQQAALKEILVSTLNVNDVIDWESLKDRSTYQMPSRFPEHKPANRISATRPQYSEPNVGLFDFLLGRKSKIINEAKNAYARLMEEWEVQERKQKDSYEAALADWQQREAAFWSEHFEKRAQFVAAQTESHNKIDLLRDQLREGDSNAVIEHASLVLDKSDYGDLFEKSFEIQYHPENKLLLVAYDLPSPDQLPQVKSARFIKSTGEISETKITEREKKANFESVSYQICLRTLHELFESDVDNNINEILFNGMVNFISPETGLDQRSCIASILVGKDQFSSIDLARVDPKICFKSLKGVSAANLVSLTPIPPVMEMDREDKRFIDAKVVGSSIDHTTNLAEISWEDFEHLVRELFEKEFLTRGGEVKVTQASSDGGVDAIAFDPDPISGGKIVIQAKRYTKTVGVSAVRDLYGTVMNEGASKGILVTTADYGPDAYRFANGKPITLLNGANLLHLLARHGYQARIDVKAARQART